MTTIQLSEKSLAIIDPLVKVELEQSTFFNQLAVIANKLGFKIAEAYFNQESIEEKEHYMGWQNYIIGRGNDFQVPAVPMPKIKPEKMTLYGLTEVAKEKEIEVTLFYDKQLSELFKTDLAAFQFATTYLNIQNDAVRFYIDACVTLDNLDKAGELTVEKRIFKI